jgi:hypothetical protein
MAIQAVDCMKQVKDIASKIEEEKKKKKALCSA